MDPLRRGNVPLLPGASLRTTCLEHEPSALAQYAVYGVQRLRPTRVVDEHLGDVPGHHGEIRRVHAPGQRRRVALDPGHAPGIRLRSCDIERGAGRVDADHVEPVLSEKYPETTGSASDVHNLASAELAHNAFVGPEIAAVVVEEVVELGQSRISETGIG